MLGVNDRLFEPRSVTAARDKLRAAIAANPYVEQRTISDVPTIEMVAAEFERLKVCLGGDVAANSMKPLVRSLVSIRLIKSSDRVLISS